MLFGTERKIPPPKKKVQSLWLCVEGQAGASFYRKLNVFTFMFLES